MEKCGTEDMYVLKGKKREESGGFRRYPEEERYEVSDSGRRRDGSERTVAESRGGDAGVVVKALNELGGQHVGLLKRDGEEESGGAEETDQVYRVDGAEEREVEGVERVGEKMRWRGWKKGEPARQRDRHGRIRGGFSSKALTNF